MGTSQGSKQQYLLYNTRGCPAESRKLLTKSSPYYCVNSKASVFNYTLGKGVFLPFYFFAKLPWCIFFISGWVCQSVFTLTDPPGYVIIP